MSSFQRIVKYIAIAFAVLLSVCIIGGIASAVFGIFTGFTGIDSMETKSFTEEYTNIEKLDIDCGISNITIKVGETFKIEANNVPENLKAEKTYDNTLRIKNKNVGFNWIFNSPSQKGEIIISLPAEFIAKNVKIDGGVSKIDIENLNSEKIQIDVGTGKVYADKIIADFIDIDGGVGNIEFADATFNRTKIDCGVGNVYITGTLLGKTEIDGGTGNINLDLRGSIDDYEFDIDKGVGKCTINGESYHSGFSNSNSANNELNVDCGVGNVNITIE